MDFRMQRIKAVMLKRLNVCAVPSLCLCLLLLSCHGNNEAGAGGERQSKGTGSETTDSGSGTSRQTQGRKSGQSGGGSSEQAEDNSEAQVPVGTVRIDPANLQRAGIRVAGVEVRRMPQQLSVAGQVAMDERHTEHIGARADGVVERVLVLPGDMVRAGQLLALLHSHSVHETAGTLAQAYAAVNRQTSAVHFQELNRTRYQRLLELKVASQEEAQRADQELQAARQQLADADATVRMEREHLSELLQVSPSSITPQTLYQQELVPIRAEGAGSVVDRLVTPGQVLTAGQPTFTVTDLRTVWVMAAVNEESVPRIHRGDAAHITTQGLGGTQLAGTVGMLGDQLDPQTRTLPVRIVVPNPGLRLRPGMFATAAIDLGATQQAIFVPEGAVQDVNGFKAVFVTPDNTNFTVRAVKLGEHRDGMVQVLQGLSPTDHIVVDGAFMVKGELLKGSVGEG